MTFEKTPVVLPEGYYTIETLQATWEQTHKSKETGSNDAWALKLKCVVKDLNHFNENIYANFNFVNPSNQAIDVSKKQWANFLLAINETFFDFDPRVGLRDQYLPILLYKTLRVKTGLWKDPKGASRTNIKGFYPMNTQPQAAPMPPRPVQQAYAPAPQQPAAPTQPLYKAPQAPHNNAYPAHPANTYAPHQTYGPPQAYAQVNNNFIPDWATEEAPFDGDIPL